MATLSTLVVKLVAETGAFISGMEQAANKTKGLAGGIGSALQGIGNIAAGAAVAGVGALAGGLTLAMKEAADAETVLAQLDSVLKSTGGAAGVTKDSVLQLADSLQQTTRFSDDQIISAQSMLLTFTNIGNDVFPGATKAVLDLSTAMGQDTKSSAMQLGKALNDPVAGISALTRVGVTFTEEQKSAIKAMVEMGDKAGAQKLILAELSKEFGGSAEAAGKTFAGRLDILKNSLLNIAEQIGTALLPLVTDLATRFAEWLSSPEVQQALKDLVSKIVEFATVVLPGLIQRVVEFAKSVIAAWNNVKSGVETAVRDVRGFVEGLVNGIVDFVNNFPERMYQLGVGLINGLWEGIKSMFSNIGQGISSFFDNTIADIKAKLGIQSPSRVFMGIGEQMMAGLASGIEEAAGLPQVALNANMADLTRAEQTGGTGRVNNYYLTAQYGYRDERSLVNDVQRMQLLTA